MSTFDSVNPARPAEVIGTYDAATAADVDRAVARRDAQRRWARRPGPCARRHHRPRRRRHRRPQGRARPARRREAGKVLVEAAGDVQEAVDMAALRRRARPRRVGRAVPSELADKLAWTTRQPVGVVGMITPWNFPVAIPSWKIFPALLAGNGVVIKPSEHAPACCEAFVARCVDAGIPAALLQVVHGPAEPGAALAVHPASARCQLHRLGAHRPDVAARAMEAGPKLVSLELGGKNAMVVLADADLELVVDGALFGAFGTAGQRCTSTSRLIVHRRSPPSSSSASSKRAEALRARRSARCRDRRRSGHHRRSADAHHRDGRRRAERGREVVPRRATQLDVDGCEGGTFVAPTVVTGVKPTTRSRTEEVFGPVLAVLEVERLDEAIDVVNASEYGLSAAIYTSRHQRRRCMLSTASTPASST